jgi:hypothetical protein
VSGPTARQALISFAEELERRADLRDRTNSIPVSPPPPVSVQEVHRACAQMARERAAALDEQQCDGDPW